MWWRQALLFCLLRSGSEFDESYFGNYFQGKCHAKKWFHREKIKMKCSQGWIYHVLGYEGFYCTHKCRLTYDCYKVRLRRVELARRAGREEGTHDTTLAGEPVRWWEGSGRAGTPPCACWWRPPCPSCPRRPWTPAADPPARGTCSSWSLFGAERASTRSANYGTATQIYTLITTIYCLKNK